MAGTKLLRGHFSVYAFFPEATADWENISATDLEAALASGLGFDISCALEDSSVSITPTDSDTDDSISICDIGNVSTPTFFNYEVTFDSFRNGPTSAGPIVPVYDIPVSLFSAPDVKYMILTRIGAAQGTALTAGQTVSAFEVATDNPADILGDQENIMFGSRFKATGQLNTNTDLV